MSKWGAFSGPHFPAFELYTEKYEVSLHIQSECGKMQTGKNFVFRHFSRRECIIGLKCQLYKGLKQYCKESWKFCFNYTARKMKLSIHDFFSKCDLVRRNLRIWSHLLKNSLMENFIFLCVKNWYSYSMTAIFW